MGSFGDYSSQHRNYNNSLEHKTVDEVVKFSEEVKNREMSRSDCKRVVQLANKVLKGRHYSIDDQVTLRDAFEGFKQAKKPKLSWHAPQAEKVSFLVHKTFDTFVRGFYESVASKRRSLEDDAESLYQSAIVNFDHDPSTVETIDDHSYIEAIEDLEAEWLQDELETVFALITPEQTRDEMFHALKDLYKDGLLEDIELVGFKKYKVNLSEDINLTYATRFMNLGSIVMSKETVVSISKLEKSHPIDEPESTTEQKIISFNPPINVKITGVYTGEIQEFVFEHTSGQTEEEEKSRCEARGAGGYKKEMDPKKVVSYLKALKWV